MMKMIRTECFAECIRRWQLGLVLFLSTVFIGPVYADDGDFTNDTMETRVTSPPPNIMFVLDNSGSMDWSFMAPESSGKFNGDGYLWSISDNVFGTSSSNGGISKVQEWQARWSGYNRLFYNPHSSYIPWPRWNQSPNTDGRKIPGRSVSKIKDNGIYPPFYADLKEPRSNPVEWEYTLNLHNTLFTTQSGNAIVVDNADGSPAYTDDFDETSTNKRPYWGDNYRWSNDNDDWARFTPNLTADKYSVWAYWPCNDSNDRKVELELEVNGTIVASDQKSQRADSDNTRKAGVCGEWISLFNGNHYQLPTGTGTKLFLYRKDDYKESYTYADAVAFLPEGETEIKQETIQVKNAHYYMVDDRNNDEKPQRGEVYLVNFEWTDSDSDGKVEEDELSRRYFLVSYDNDSGNHEDVTSLTEVNYDPNAKYDADGDGVADEADAVPDSIQPIAYDDTLKKNVFVSDLEDLQNFANWFSFYRRRELTAKAAVSRTIAELDNVYVGYNTMHRTFSESSSSGGGAKQPVLPIDVYESILSGDAEIIVDNKDTGFSKSGKFSYVTQGEYVTKTTTKTVEKKVPKNFKNQEYNQWGDKQACKKYARDKKNKNTSKKQDKYCKTKNNKYEVEETVTEQVWVPSTTTEVNSWVEASRNINMEHKSSSLKTQDHDLSSDPDKWAKFTPNIQEAGSYKVSAWWPCSTDADTKAKITVKHEFGSTTKSYNQKASSDDTVSRGNCTSSSGIGCCGYWVELGEYNFEAGQNGFVEIRRHSGSEGSVTAADAVKFEMEGILNTDKINQLDTLLDVLYQVRSSGGTPLRQTLQEVGKYYDDEDNSNGGIGDCPYLSVDQGGACQQSYAIAMTDGFWNGDSPGVGHQDRGKGAPYADNHDNTLADVAMRYYDTDLVHSLPNEMATNNYDKKKTQHMVTFGVSFGLDGTIDPTDIDNDGVADHPSYADDPYFLNSDTPRPSWPDPSDDKPTTIDDLWHATVNGRGRYFSAKDPDTLVQALKETFTDISNRKASGASVSVNGDELSTGLILYQSTYKSGAWEGNVNAFPIDPETGEIHRGECQSPGDDKCVLWRTQEILEKQNWDTGRNIFTFNGSAGVPFRYNNLDKAQQDALSLDNKGGQEVLNFLRGGPSEVEIDDPNNPGQKQRVRWFRKRNVKLGDLVHSAPLLVSAVHPESDGIDNDQDGVIDEGEAMDYSRLFDGIDNDGDGQIDEKDEKHDGRDNDGDGQVDEEEPQEVGGTLFAGGNDGMLHAFNAETGKERFAYVPLRSFDYLFELSKDDYDHRYYVDGRQSFKRLRFLAGDQTSDHKDNDGDGLIDDDDLGLVANGGEDYSDKVDNDGDGTTDEPFEYKTVTLLVGTLNKGGRGIYALDISKAECIFADISHNSFDANKTKCTLNDSQEGNLAQSMVMWEYPPKGPDGMEYAYVGREANQNYGDQFDNDGDGAVDEEGERALLDLSPAAADGLDNDKDGEVDEADELKTVQLDPDMGYSYGDAFIARSYITKNEAYDTSDHPWVVIFGNGYQSRNGQAVLYIVNALTGDLIRKIVAGPPSNNGLSSPAIVDVDNDDRVDFVYAGDLVGNMWKFDLRDPDPKNWGVIYGTNADQTATRIDYNDVNISGDRDEPKPLINVGRPITTAPDVAYHCEEHGYIVVFGTGKFLGGNDVGDRNQQGIFGIWDFGDNPQDYLGNWRSSDNSFPDPGRTELKNVQLLDQVEIDWRKYDGSYLRTLSGKKPQWSASDLCYNGIDDDGDGTKDNESCVPLSGNVGWFFDLPYHLGLDGVDNDSDGDIDEYDESTTLAGERVVKDVLIRHGNAVVISLIPGDSPCDGGGNSIVHEMPFCTGGRLTEPVFDINHDGVIDDKDYLLDANGNPLQITDENGDTIILPTPPNGSMHDGILHKPVVVGDPDEEKERELKIFSSSAGTTEIMWEKKEKIGFYYWREH